MSRITFALTPHPPFSLELTAWALRRRAANEIDLWDSRNYTRIFITDGDALKVSVSQAGGPSRWQPYAGFVSFHFLLDSLKTRGYLP
jgi:hypothetical protein